MTKPNQCPEPEEHHLHMCQLKAKQMHKDIEKLVDSPKVVCANCGARANRPENLCQPKPI